MNPDLKPLTDWTDEMLSAEHSAAYYFYEGSYDADEVKRAGKRISEIEAEMTRREAARAVVG